MDILYCGDEKIEDGLILSILSLLKNVKEPLHIFVLTIYFCVEGKEYHPISGYFAAALDKMVKKVNSNNFVSLIDITEMFCAQVPEANLGTRFTPCCMLRLFADKIPELPEKILYLDNDVICRKDCSEFFHQDISDYEFAGVLDYYGRWLFRRNLLKPDYQNSGVLLMNMQMLRKSGLLQKCRELCAEKKMFMPDQSALNKLAVSKKIVPRRFNEQRRLQKDTVLQHFTTSFRFFPWLHVVTVKPWDIERMHSELNLYEYDKLLHTYRQLHSKIKEELQESVHEKI
ncbi:glycosyltransferase [Muricomes intestini]|uniref:glycosyltransferase n=1 Tax=Muricomes intestini TaxID=1796634 RepID=UPI002FE2A6B4